MLRNLFMAGLTALLLAALASSAHAARSTTTRKKSEASQHGQASAPEADRPLRPAAKKVVVKVRSRAGAARQRVARRVHNVVVNQGLIRQSWTIADLNPMPSLLDLDDTVDNLRRATAAIVRAMRR